MEFADLPFDVLYLIFEYIHVSDSRSIKLTCRRFYNISKMIRFSGGVTIHKDRSFIIPKCQYYTLLGNPDKLPTNVLQDTFRWSRITLCTGSLADKYHSFIYAKSLVVNEIANAGMTTLPNVFENIEYLGLKSFKSLTNVDAVSQLPAIKYFTMKECNKLEFIHGIRNLDVLDIEDCKSLTILDNCSNIKTVRLSSNNNLQVVEIKGKSDLIIMHYCPKVRTLIGNAKRVRLYGSVGIEDISSLVDVEDLNINGCTKITDISMLKNLRKLSMNGCVGITDLSALTLLEELSMHGCTGVTDISMLKNLRKLNMDYCTGVSDVSELTLLEELSMDNCINVKDINMLKKLRKLNISHCTGITNIDTLPLLEELRMDCCANVVTISILPNIKFVSMYSCHGVKDVDGLMNVNILHVNDCWHVRGVEKLTNLKELAIGRFSDYNIGMIRQNSPGVNIIP